VRLRSFLTGTDKRYIRLASNRIHPGKSFETTAKDFGLTSKADSGPS
jgi:hypothetical protein